MLIALDLFSTRHLPTTHRHEDRDWHTSQLVPMGGRVILELPSCVATDERLVSGWKQQGREFVRINVNDGIVALLGCEEGPGRNCRLKDFLAYVKRRGEEVGVFGEVCELGDGAAESITFLHQ